jgi:hypothetical protein
MGEKLFLVSLGTGLVCFKVTAGRQLSRKEIINLDWISEILIGVDKLLIQFSYSVVGVIENST